MSVKNVLIMYKGYNLAKDAWDQFAEKYNAKLIQCTATSKDEFLEYFKKDEIQAIASTVPGARKFGGFTAEIAEALPPSVKVISHHGAGYDSLGDVSILTKKGIAVSNTPDAVVNATADTTLWLILGALRDFNRLSYELRKGNWTGKVELASEPETKTLGILGMGSIGRKVRDKAVGALNFSRIQYHNRRRLDPEQEKNSVYVEFDELLATSDVLCICMPLNNETHHLIDAKALAKCKEGAVIVNTARGAIIDEQALVDALESGKIKSVGLDVFEFEPEVNKKLLENPDVLILPHAGTHTEFTRRKMELQVIANIEAFSTTGKVLDVIPEQR